MVPASSEGVSGALPIRTRSEQTALRLPNLVSDPPER